MTNLIKLLFAFIVGLAFCFAVRFEQASNNIDSQNRFTFRHFIGFLIVWELIWWVAIIV